jgi:hypothetical protein
LESSSIDKLVIVKPEEFLPTPETSFHPFLARNLVLEPFSEDDVTVMSAGIELFIFVDIENVQVVFSGNIPDFVMVFLGFGREFNQNVVITSELVDLALKKKLMVLCGGDGKERADSALEAAMVDLHYLLKDKEKAMVVVSKDQGFKIVQTYIHRRGRKVMQLFPFPGNVMQLKDVVSESCKEFGLAIIAKEKSQDISRNGNKS